MKANTPKLSDIKIVKKDWMPEDKLALVSTPNPTPTTLRDLLTELAIDCQSFGETPAKWGSPPDIEETAQSIQEQLKALLPEKINAEMPNATTVAYNRCLSDVKEAIEEWAR